jgi:hypothetical protein
MGHVEKVCKSEKYSASTQSNSTSSSNPRYKRGQTYKKEKKNRVPVQYVADPDSNAELTDEDSAVITSDTQLFNTRSESSESGKQRYEVVMSLNDIPCSMEIDTGASVALCSEATYVKTFKDIPLEKSEKILHSYTNEDIPVIGEIPVKVEYKSHPLI